MTNQEAIKYLRQLYPYGGHCWLDEQRTEAIGMAIEALKEEPTIATVGKPREAEGALKELLDNIDEKELTKVREEMMQEEPSIPEIVDEHSWEMLGEEPVSEELEKAMQHNAPDNIGIDDLLYWRNGFIAGTNWQKTKEEPVSDDLNTELNKYIKGHFTIDTEQLDKFGIDEEDYMYSMDKSDILELVKHFTNWHKTKDESITEDLGEYINKLSKQFPDVSFAKLSRIAVRVAKWQKEKEYTCYEEAFEDGAKWKVENLLKPADGDDLPEIDREVIVLCKNGRIAFGHRPVEKFIARSIGYGRTEEYEVKTYDKGGWNIPNVKYWLDVKLPKEIEL